MAYVRVTSVPVYVEHIGDALRVTSSPALTELNPAEALAVTAASAYLELTSAESIHVTTLGAYVEIGGTEPAATTPIEQGSGAAYVAEVVGLIATIDTGYNVSHMQVYAELIDRNLLITKFINLVEIALDDLRITKFLNLIEIEYEEPPPGEPVMPTYFPRADGSRAMHSLLPDEVTGYAFDPQHSWWSFIVPAETENLVLNPSFEGLDDGLWGYHFDSDWAAYEVLSNASVGATGGRRCLRLVVNNDDDDAQMGFTGRQYIAANNTYVGDWVHVTPGHYCWSLDLYCNTPGTKIILRIIRSNDTDGTWWDPGSETILRQRTIEFTETGWKRYNVNYTELASGNVVLQIHQPGTTVPGIILYTDCWQFENKLYATTYADGDMVGWFDRAPAESYFWTGIPHRSSTIRRNTTGSGGAIVSLSDTTDFLTTAIIGLGMAPVEGEYQEVGRGRELHKRINTNPRDFTIVGRIYGEDYSIVSRKIRDLINLVRPNNTPGTQPLILCYQPTDSTGAPYGMPMQIVCHYNEGLEGNTNNFYQSQIGLQFHASSPYPYEPIDSYVPLLGRTTLPCNGLVHRHYTHLFDTLGSGVTIGLDGFITIGAVNYAEGRYPIIALDMVSGFVDTIMGDSTPVTNVVYYADGSWHDLDSDKGYLGVFKAIDCAYGDDAPIVVVGNFIPDAGTGFYNVAMGSLISGWVGLTDDGMDDTAWDVCHDNNNRFYIVGAFTQDHGGVDDYPYVVSWAQGESWTALNGGFNADAFVCVTDGEDYVYFGGFFTAAYNTAPALDAVSCGYCMRWNIKEQTFEAMANGRNGMVIDMLIAQDGFLYAIGYFDGDWGPAGEQKGIARWNGYNWEQVFDFSLYFDMVDDEMSSVRMEMDEKGVIWFYIIDNTYFHDVPGIGTCNMFGWKNGVFYPPFLQINGSTVGLTSIKFQDHGDAIFATADANGTNVYAPYLNEFTYYGTADAAPTLVMNEGIPYSVYHVDKQAQICFDSDLTIYTGEEMRLILGGSRHRFFSNARTNLMKNIVVGPTNLRDFRLRPGNNRISMYNRIQDTDTVIYLLWNNTYWSIDPGAAQP